MVIGKRGILDVASSVFGLICIAIGIINTFWGNDTFYGIFLILLSLVFFPAVTRMIHDKIGFAIPGILKIVLALFVIWSSLGVGELFDKIALMQSALGLN